MSVVIESYLKNTEGNWKHKRIDKSVILPLSTYDNVTTDTCLVPNYLLHDENSI